MSIFFSFFFVLLSLCVCLCRPVRLTDANTPKKCRALFGLDQLSLWCKPCRYYCCRTNGRKTSAKSTFFSLIITHCASKTQLPPCGNRWQTLCSFSTLRNFLLKIPSQQFPSYILVQAQWQKMDFQMRWPNIWSQAETYWRFPDVNLEAPFSQADRSKSIFSPGCGWFPSILTVVFVLIGVLFFFFFNNNVMLKI